MKRLALILFMCFSGICCFPQEMKNIDFVLIIDGANHYIPCLDFIVTDNKGKADTVVARYHPGNLSVPIEDYRRMLSDSTRTLKLRARMAGVGGEYFYQFDIDNYLLDNAYVFVRIINPRSSRKDPKTDRNGYLKGPRVDVHRNLRRFRVSIESDAMTVTTFVHPSPDS